MKFDIVYLNNEGLDDVIKTLVLNDVDLLSDELDKEQVITCRDDRTNKLIACAKVHVEDKYIGVNDIYICHRDNFLPSYKTQIYYSFIKAIQMFAVQYNVDNMLVSSNNPNPELEWSLENNGYSISSTKDDDSKPCLTASKHLDKKRTFNK